MSYQGGSSSDYGEQMRKLPYKIIPGEESTHNMNIWLERAIVSERIRLAMGLSLRPISQQVATDEGLEHSVIADKYYEPPLINVIKFACNRCPEKLVQVTDLVPGLPCASLPGSLPQKGHLLPEQPLGHRPGPVHQVRPLCGRLPLPRRGENRAPLRRRLRHGRHRQRQPGPRQH